MTSDQNQHFAQLLRSLRGRLSIDQPEMGKQLGVSREWISRLENNTGKFSELILVKMNPLLRRCGMEEIDLAKVMSHHGSAVNPVSSNVMVKVNGVSKFLAEDDAPDRRDSIELGQGEPVQFREGFQPPAPTPTRQDCMKYLEEYLRRAEREAGAIGYAYRVLLKTFPLDEFDASQKK